VKNPSYDQVCSGRTGHAEVVQVGFDPDVVSFRDLLDIFFTIHDPTTLNRQGADVGTQYRSVIFYHDEAQHREALEKIRQLEAEGVWSGPIVTEVAPLPEFFPAEEYHRRYYARNPNQGYCQVVIAPKIAKLRKQHFDRLVGRGEQSRSAEAGADPSAKPQTGRERENPATQGAGMRGAESSPRQEGQIRPYQSAPKNPIDQGGIED
jgi:peptide-methionine (S)-S-oxide reductase